MHKRGYSRHAVSDRLSVCLSVTFVDHVKTNKHIVNNRAFNGDLGSNPFNFKHYNLSEIALYLDGQQQFALKPIQSDYANGLYIRAYESLFTSTGK